MAIRGGFVATRGPAAPRRATLCKTGHGYRWMDKNRTEKLKINKRKENCGVKRPLEIELYRVSRMTFN